MKKILYAAFLILLSGCIHEYPDGEGTDPTRVAVDVGLTLDMEWEEYRNGTKGGSADGYSRRFIVEVQREGETVFRRAIVPEEFTEGQTPFLFSETLSLHALQYTVAVWSDYVETDSEDDGYYDASHLRNVTVKEPYTGNTDYRDCHYSTLPLDLRPYRGQWNARVHLDMDMERPLARYRIIATDAADFLETARSKFPGETEFNIRFSYGFYFPLAFSAWEGRPADSRLGVAFTDTLVLPADGTEELLLGSDHIFVNGTESYIPLSIEITAGGGDLVGKLGGLNVPYERGCVTTVRGRFLTAMFGSGGIGIDPGFDGDIDIDLDNF